MAQRAVAVIAALLIAAIVPLVPGIGQGALLSSDDRATYRQAFAAVDKGDWDRAAAIAARASDPALAEVLRGLSYLRPRNGASFLEIADFIQANPHWPMLWTMSSRAEEAISPADPDEAVLDWFAERTPITTDGAIAYARTLVRNGSREQAEALVRSIWVDGTFGSVQERQFLGLFGSMIQREHHIARLDRLLWDRHLGSARRMLPRVPDDVRRLAEARIALSQMQPGVDGAINRVPAALRDHPGLVFERLQWRRRKGRHDSAAELLEHPAADQGRPDMWWTERAIIARDMLKRGHISRAYAIAGEHRQTDGAGFAQAEWLAGWIALRFLGDSKVAFDHFQRLYDGVSFPVSLARGAYWSARAAEAMGEPNLAGLWYQTAAEHVTTYYGQLAASRLKDEGRRWPLPTDPLPSAQDMERFNTRPLVRIVRMLAEVDAHHHAQPFLIHLGDKALTPGERALAAGLAVDVERADVAVTIARRVSQNGTVLIASGYPVHALALPEDPERALTMALIRQESGFDPLAVSPAGARGLMQLMPATAQSLSREMNLRYSRERLLDDPHYNIVLGTRYMLRLLERYGGSYILAIAAYNAGPTRVNAWIRELGDPRDADIDPVDWIESIPFHETRNYVQRVLEGTQVYRRRLGQTELALSLEGDLNR